MKGILLVIALCVLCFLFGRHSVKREVVRVVETDTLVQAVPQPSFVVDVSEVDIPYPVTVYRKGDTVRVHDTVRVKVPISRKVYETADYRAVVSGFRPSLDSMQVYRRKETVYKRERRWGIGVMAGYGVGRNGLSPYAGAGVYYRVW